MCARRRAGAAAPTSGPHQRGRPYGSRPPQRTPHRPHHGGASQHVPRRRQGAGRPASSPRWQGDPGQAQTGRSADETELACRKERDRHDAGAPHALHQTTLGRTRQRGGAGPAGGRRGGGARRLGPLKRRQGEARLAVGPSLYHSGKQWGLSSERWTTRTGRENGGTRWVGPGRARAHPPSAPLLRCASPRAAGRRVDDKYTCHVGDDPSRVFADDSPK